MKVNAQAFFSFCSTHIPLLWALTQRTGEFSETEVSRLIRETVPPTAELPDTTWRRLREFQILVPAEPGGDSYLLAEPVSRLLAYLFNEAKPATSEMIEGFIQSLDTVAKRLSTAIREENVTEVESAFDEISVTLRRIHAGLDETHHAILLEIGRYKTERLQVSVREKFRRIVFWMQRYVEPMVQIVRTDGPLRATFEEVERLLRVAREQSLFNDSPALDRNLRFLRIIAWHALRVFTQCRKEIQPLYEKLRRSSLIAEGASIALEKLQNEGIANWGTAPLIGIYSLRFVNVPGDAAIASTLRRVIDHPPSPPPTVDFSEEDSKPADFVTRVWLNTLPDTVEPDLPLPDLLEWLVSRHPDKNTAAVLAGFTELVFDAHFEAAFSKADPRLYATTDGSIKAAPVALRNNE